MVQASKEITPAHAMAVLRETPNGVMVVDEAARIHFVNRAFRQMFQCDGQDLLGRPAQDFVHSDCFARAIASGGALAVTETVGQHDVTFRAAIFPVQEPGLYCGIFVDVTEEERVRRRLNELSASTLERAQEVIARQMRAAQEIARLLGESTAETKVLLVKLMSLFREKEHL